MGIQAQHRLWHGPGMIQKLPMLIQVRLFGAMLGLYLSHLGFPGLLLIQERLVSFKLLPGTKGTCRFWVMSGSCGMYMDLYGAYVGPG